MPDHIQTTTYSKDDGRYSNFPAAIVEYGADGCFVACSPAHERLFPQCAAYFRPGVRRIDILTAYARNCDDATAWLETRTGSLGEPRPAMDETLPDGRVMRISECRTADGGILCVSTEISEIAHNGGTASQRDDQLQYFANSSSDWFWETDARLRFVYVSGSVGRIAGVQPEWIYGKTREELIGDEIDEEALRQHLSLLRQRRPFHNFTYFRPGNADIAPKWISTSGLPIFNEAGTFVGYRGIGRDVTAQKETELELRKSEAELREVHAALERRVAERTQELQHEIAERKRVEKALTESERRFRHAFEHAPSGIALLTPEGRRLKVNHALAAFLRATVEELRDTSMNSSVTSPEDMETDRALRQAVIDGKQTTYHNERSYRRKDGRIVWGEVTGSLVRDDEGKPLYIVAHTVDTTQRRENERLLREANEKLEQRVEDRTRELHESNAALRQEIAQRERIGESLQASESRFQDFAKSASDWFWESDEQHRFVTFLDPQDLLPKSRRESHLGRTRAEASDADLTDELWRQHQSDLAAHRPFRDFRYRTVHNGEERHWSSSGRPVFDQNRKFVGYRGTGTDITHQVELERKVSEQSRLLGKILDNLPVHVALLDQDGRYSFINRYGAEKMGRDTTAFVGKRDQELFGHEDGDSFCALATAALQSDAPVVNRTVRPIHWGGREALLNIVPMNEPDGSVTGALVVAQDVTELSDAQAAIREREALLDAIIEHIPAFLTMKSAETGVYQLTNERFNRIIGLPREQIIGRRTEDIYADPGDIRTILRHEKRVLSTRKAVTEDRELAGSDGVQRMSATKFPVFDDSGKIVGIGSVTIDISEQRRIEEQLRHSQKLEVVGQLTGGLAHDFNNLLGVVIGNLDFLEESLRNRGELHAMVTAATNAALHGGELTRQLLAFSRRQPLQPRKLEINLQLVQMLGLLRRTLGETIDVALKRDPDLWHCEADPSQVEAAILNLSLNARDAMPKGGSLTLTTANTVFTADDVANETELEPGDYVVLTVTDTGCGMSPDVQERAFEPFFTTKQVGDGSGLGLSMVFGFAKQSGGHVTIRSQEGHGTSISLFLPRANRTDAPQIETARHDVPSGQGERILVVEDDPDLRRLTVTQLQDLGYNVIAAKDGKSALEMIRVRTPIDLLLTDVVLPGGMDGVGLAQEIRKRQNGASVMFMSGYSDHTAVGQSVSNDAVLLQKPFRKAELARRVSETLSNRAN